MIADSVNIMGTPWKISMRSKKDDSSLAGISGYCDNTIKTIVLRKHHDKPKPGEVSDLREYERSCLRHEIIHAFMFESGLSNSADASNHWAMHEEMIDWIANQHEKIHSAYLEAGAILPG